MYFIYQPFALKLQKKVNRLEKLIKLLKKQTNKGEGGKFFSERY